MRAYIRVRQLTEEEYQELKRSQAFQKDGYWQGKTGAGCAALESGPYPSRNCREARDD